jgi:hypothetical protein
VLVAVEHARLYGGLRLGEVMLDLLVHVLHLLRVMAVGREVLNLSAFRVGRLIYIVTHWLGISNLIF